MRFTTLLLQIEVKGGAEPLLKPLPYWSHILYTFQLMSNNNSAKNANSISELGVYMRETWARMDIQNKELKSRLEEQNKELRASIDAFGKRMDKHSEELRASLEAFGKRMDKHGEDTKNSVKSLVAEMKGFINNESNTIESEVNRHVADFLRNDSMYQGHLIYDVTKTWKYLKKPWITPKDSPQTLRQPITEFDGLFFITKHHKFKRIFGDFDAIRDEVNDVNSKDESFFLVVEAKHRLTNDNISEKLDQMQKFQEIITYAREYKESEVTNEFITRVNQFDLSNVSRKLHIVFGSKDMGDNQIRKIKSMYDSLSKDNMFIGYVMPSGDRYELYHGLDNFEQNRLLYASAIKLRAGGRAKKRKVQNKHKAA